MQGAFTHYHAALTEPDDKARAELLLLANLEIGFHEQTRLQPEIREALDAPVYEPGELRRRLMTELFPNPGARLRLAAAWLAGRAAPLMAAQDQLAHEVQRLGRLAITELMMTLDLPGERVLRLGDDVRAEYPAPLRALANPDLCALMEQVDPAPGGPDGAADWSDLPARMRFIADLFRAYHLDAALFDPPFTVEQTAALKAGRRPIDI